MDLRSCVSVLALLVAPNVWAAESTVNLMDFQANGIVAMAESGESISGQVSWTPLIPIGSLYVRGDLGASMYKGTVSNFIVAEAGARAGIDFGALSAEVGPMAQMWLARSTYIGGLAQLNYGFGSNLFGMVDRVFLSGGMLFPSGMSIMVAKLGVGFSF